MMRASRPCFRLTNDGVSVKVRNCNYAIRGPLLARAKRISRDLKDPEKRGNYKFDKVIYAHNGNPQAHGQPPLSFAREVLAITTHPKLLTSEGLFAKDVIERSRKLISDVEKQGFSTGSYSESQGYLAVRKAVAEFIQRRDESELATVDPQSIFIGSATRNALSIMRSILGVGDDGIMIPKPHYPLYTAGITLFNGTVAPYYLDEDNGWAMSTNELELSYSAAKSVGVNPKALVVINPGNPTGTVLEPAVMREVLDFCHRKKLLLIADEVYQENVYDKKFHSFREVLLGTPYWNELQLASLHSTSKGMLGECGRRGGYLHLMNVDPRTMLQWRKLPEINLCPNVAGQVMTDIMVNPPEPGDVSYKQYRKEYDAVYNTYRKRAKNISAQLNDIPGMSCSQVHGAMYAFPRLHFTDKFIAHSKADGVDPDARWCEMVLDEAGVLLIPGVGFGQREGTYHFRTTMLPKNIEECIGRIAKFQETFDGKK